MPSDPMEDWFCSSSGRRLFVANPDPDAICIEDIAHALSHICRFGGHVDNFYSVAQHSVLVSLNVSPKGIAREALLHDAAEAYIGDVIHPLKQCLPDYKRIERLWEAAITARFGLHDSPEVATRIKLADLEALVTERRDVCSPSWSDHPWVADELGITPWPERIDPLGPISAHALFMRRWEQVQ